MTVSSLAAEAPRLKAFRQGLLESGYAGGHNIVIEPRSADGIYERLPGLAGELLKMNSGVILSGGSSATRVAHKVKTAKQIGLTILPNMLARADRVIK